MSRSFLVPVLLPADPVGSLEAATKQYVDNTRPQAGRTFYYTDDVSDIATYKKMLAAPSQGVETTFQVSCNSSSDFLLGVFATDPGVPNITFFPAGTATRRHWVSVSTGSARLHLQVYVRTAAGVETLVRDEFSDTFNNTTPALVQTMITQPAGGTMNPTDRLVAKLYAQRISGATVVVTVYAEGSARASHIVTTIGASGGAVNLDALTDVTLTSPTDTQVLTYEASTSQWKNKAAPSGGGSTNLDGLTDVTVLTPVDGQVLTYNSGTSQWGNEDPPAGTGGTVAGTKLSALASITGALLATLDLIEVVDVSDTTMATSGTNKKITIAELVNYLATTSLGTDTNTLGPDGDKGDVTVGGTGTTLTIDNAAVTGPKIGANAVDNTKLAQMTPTTIKGNNSGSNAQPVDLSIVQTLDMLDVGGSGYWHRYQFSTTTTAGPATQTVRFNNATLASVTAIYVNYTAVDADVKTRLLARTAGDRFYVQSITGSGNFLNVRLTAAPVDNTTYATLNVVVEASGGSFQDGINILAGFPPEPKLTAINAQTGTTYTLVMGDIYKLVTLNNAGAITLTVPANSAVAFPVGTTIDLAQLGAGQVTVTQSAGVTVNGTPSKLLRTQYSAATLIKYATDTWLLVGDLA